MSPAFKVCVVAIVLLAGAALADSPAPRPEGPVEYRSDNGRFLLRAIPGSGGSDAELLEGPRSLWKRRFVNAFMPANALVSDDGRHVATFDEWESSGEGPNVVVLYGPGGALVGRWSLEQLLTEEELLLIGHSVSNRFWAGMAGPRPPAEFDLKAGHLVLHVQLAGNRPPMMGPGPGRDLRISLAQGQVLNRAAEKSMAADDLVARFHAAAEPQERELTLALMRRHPAPRLRAFWMERLTAPDASGSELGAALSWLQDEGTTGDVQSLLALRGTGRSTRFDLGVSLEAMRKRVPFSAGPLLARAADPQASLNDRSDAVRYALASADEPWDALRVGMKTGQPFARRVVLEYIRLHPSARAFPHVLDGLADPEEWTRKEAQGAMDASLEARHEGARACADLLFSEVQDPRSRLRSDMHVLAALEAALDRQGDGARARALQPLLYPDNCNEACRKEAALPLAQHAARMAYQALSQQRPAEAARWVVQLRRSPPELRVCEPQGPACDGASTVGEAVAAFERYAKAPLRVGAALAGETLRLTLRNEGAAEFSARPGEAKLMAWVWCGKEPGGGLQDVVGAAPPEAPGPDTSRITDPALRQRLEEQQRLREQARNPILEQQRRTLSLAPGAALELPPYALRCPPGIAAQPIRVVVTVSLGGFRASARLPIAAFGEFTLARTEEGPRP